MFRFFEDNRVSPVKRLYERLYSVEALCQSKKINFVS
jgi:hypothetical protein